MRRRELLAGLSVAFVAAETRAQGQSRVLVLGATGRIGRDIAQTIRDAGYLVRATTRDPDRARKEIGGDYEWVKADVRDPESLVGPLKDVSFIVSSIRSSDWAGPYNPEFVDYHGMRNLVDAARTAGVKHFVLISTATSGPHMDQSKNAAKNYVRYFKTKGEAYLRESGLSYTIIAPGRVPYEPGGKVGVVLENRLTYDTASITSGDIALVALDALTNPAARGKAFALRNDAKTALGVWKTQYAAMPTE
jgi:uncharacterized protein YbjT (DUF2867 family)